MFKALKPSQAMKATMAKNILTAKQALRQSIGNSSSATGIKHPKCITGSRMMRNHL